jgi:hypothetical protein
LTVFLDIRGIFFSELRALKHLQFINKNCTREREFAVAETHEKEKKLTYEK